MTNKFIKQIYDRPGRYYHNWSHIEYLMDKINTSGRTEKEKLILTIVAIYHDVVYDPKSKTNEEDSANFFKENFDRTEHEGITKGDEDLIYKMILETKHGVEGTTKLSRFFSEIDNGIIYEDYPKLLEWEEGIFKEYQYAPYPEYKKERVKFLKSIDQTEDIKKLIDYVNNRKIRIGLYAGSFNPYHIGHEDIVRQAEGVFDKVIVVQLQNPAKGIPSPLPKGIFQETIRSEKMLHQIAKEVSSYAEVSIIRGLRNGFDLEYEKNIMQWVNELSNKELQFIFLYCKREYEHISSSSIRQLQGMEENVDKWLVK